MPTNLELKVAVTSFAPILQKLKTLRAKKSDMLKQKDVYFRSTSGLMKLRTVNGRQEFIYYERNEEAKKRWSNYEVLEIDHANAERFFKQLFPIEAVVIKTRELFLFKKTRIHLDTVRGLGKYLELETVVTGTKAEARKEFEHVKKVLDIGSAHEIRDSYRSLILRKDVQK